MDEQPPQLAKPSSQSTKVSLKVEGVIRFAEVVADIKMQVRFFWLMAFMVVASFTLLYLHGAHMITLPPEGVKLVTYSIPGEVIAALTHVLTGAIGRYRRK